MIIEILKNIGIDIVIIIAFYVFSKLQMKAWLEVLDKHLTNKNYKIKKDDKKTQQF